VKSFKKVLHQRPVIDKEEHRSFAIFHVSLYLAQILLKLCK